MTTNKTIFLKKSIVNSISKSFLNNQDQYGAIDITIDQRTAAKAEVNYTDPEQYDLEVNYTDPEQYDFAVTFTREELLNALTSTVMAVSANREDRYALCGVRFNLTQNEFAATNGHRLHVFKINPIKLDGKVKDITIDSFAIKDMINIIKGNKHIETFTLYCVGEYIHFTCLSMRAIIDLSFPDYKKVIPNYNSYFVINSSIVKPLKSDVKYLASRKKAIGEAKAIARMRNTSDVVALQQNIEDLKIEHSADFYLFIDVINQKVKITIDGITESRRHNIANCFECVESGENIESDSMNRHFNPFYIIDAIKALCNRKEEEQQIKCYIDANNTGAPILLKNENNIAFIAAMRF